MKKKFYIFFLTLFFSIDCFAFALKSKAFRNNQKIPAKYTCEGQNVSPQLSWSGVPEDTKSFAIICDDPDAPTKEPFVHWVIFNINGEVKGLPENILPKKFFKNIRKSNEERLVNVKQGTNNFGKIGFGGPCPPKGHGVHRYFFKIYALNKVLRLKAGSTKDQLLRAMKGHILAETKLVGKFKR